jgi:hypothetical protein
MAGLAANPQSWPTHPLSMGYQYPERVPQDAWRDYLTGTAGTIERAPRGPDPAPPPPWGR